MRWATVEPHVFEFKQSKLSYQANIQAEKISSSHNDLIVLQLKLSSVPRGNNRFDVNLGNAYYHMTKVLSDSLRLLTPVGISVKCLFKG